MMRSETREYQPQPDETPEEAHLTDLVCTIAAVRGGARAIAAIHHYKLERHWPEVVVELNPSPTKKRTLWDVVRGR